MAFSLFLCGPRVLELSAAAPAIVEELEGRGLEAAVLDSRGGGLEALVASLGALPPGVSRVVLLGEPSRARREALVAGAPEAVVVDWPGEGPFEPTPSPHLTLPAGCGALEGLREVFALLEGLGYVPYAAAVTEAQEAELVERLKDLGYV